MLGPVAKWGFIVTAVVVLLPVVMLAILSLTARRPSTLGPVAGKLRPCPESPNCVCSCDNSTSHAIAPLVWKGDADEGLRRLTRVIATFPNARCDAIERDYLHAEFTSSWFRFVDDVEFLVDRSAGVIQMRSASRAGHSDLGVNRKRMDRIRELFDGSD